MTQEEQDLYFAEKIIIEEQAYSRGYEDAKKEFERPHGEWIKERLQIDERHFRSYAKCKACGCKFKPYSFAAKEFDFCPKCGSDNRPREEGKT